MNNHSTAHCPAIEDIEALAQGELDSRAIARIEAHLDQCSICRERHEEFAKDESLARELRRLPVAEAADPGSAITIDLSDGQPLGNATATDAPIPGYKIDHELSHGGQGVVYQALQESTKRKVALKVLLDGRFASKNARMRFEREVELAASLSHPNIVAVFDSGQTPDGRQYYAMDFVDGLTLTDYVRESALTMGEALKLFTKVCAAVQFAHQRGVIHRDLKPSNILVDARGEPRILDFGLAKSIRDDSQSPVSLTGQLVGTLPYMSPEQVRGLSSEIDARTDIYALGVLLYEMLTGRFPYPVAGQLADVLRHIIETEPTPPSRSWTGEAGVPIKSAKVRRTSRCPIDNEVQTIVLKLLSKEPQRRYQSAGELKEEIQRYLDGDPIDAKRDSTWYVLRKLAVRHAYATVITAAMVVALIGFTGISFYYWQESERALVEVRRKDRLATTQTRQIAHLHGDVLMQLRQMTLGWFLLEWRAGRLDRARAIKDSMFSDSPEAMAGAFLLADDASSVSMLKDLTKARPALACFVSGERLLKAKSEELAKTAFEECVSLSQDHWLKDSCKARVEALLQSTGSEDSP
jgi:serine/threonine protein kinase